MGSAELIVTEAFKAHFIKEVGWSQLMGAAKTLLDKNQQMQLKVVEKAKLIMPLAEALIKNNTVEVKRGASLLSLSRDDVKKIGTF